jgi:transposase
MKQPITTLQPVETVGLDLGDRRTNFCHLRANGQRVDEGVVATSRVGLTKFLDGLPRSRVVVEACGHVHWVAEVVARTGHEVIVANPREVRLISQSGRKNDRNDARMLAQLGRVDPELLRPVKLRSEEFRVSRSLLHARDHLVRTRTKLVNLVRGQVKSFGGRVPGGSAASFHKRAAEHVPTSLREVCAPVLAVLEQLAEQIRVFDRRIEQVSDERHPQTAVLRQVQGVGPILALAYVATIEDPGRFTSSRTVGNYVGLAPGQYASGAKTPQLRISKRGDRLLRRLLVNAASYILGPFGQDSDLRRFGERIARGGSQRDRARARIAVARKLACLLHHLWRTGSVWTPLHAN